MLFLKINSSVAFLPIIRSASISLEIARPSFSVPGSGSQLVVGNLLLAVFKFLKIWIFFLPKYGFATTILFLFVDSKFLLYNSLPVVISLTL